MRTLNHIQKISFIIPNGWGQYLYHILSPIKDMVDGTWEVYGTAIIGDLQAWHNINGEMVDLISSIFQTKISFQYSCRVGIISYQVYSA